MPALGNIIVLHLKNEQIKHIKPFSTAPKPSEIKIKATLGLSKIRLKNNKNILFKAKRNLINILGGGFDFWEESIFRRLKVSAMDESKINLQDLRIPPYIFLLFDGNAPTISNLSLFNFWDIFNSAFYGCKLIVSNNLI